MTSPLRRKPRTTARSSPLSAPIAVSSFHIQSTAFVFALLTVSLGQLSLGQSQDHGLDSRGEANWASPTADWQADERHDWATSPTAPRSARTSRLDWQPPKPAPAAHVTGLTGRSTVVEPNTTARRIDPENIRENLHRQVSHSAPRALAPSTIRTASLNEPVEPLSANRQFPWDHTPSTESTVHRSTADDPFKDPFGDRHVRQQVVPAAGTNPSARPATAASDRVFLADQSWGVQPASYDHPPTAAGGRSNSPLQLTIRPNHPLQLAAAPIDSPQLAQNEDEPTLDDLRIYDDAESAKPQTPKEPPKSFDFQAPPSNPLDDAGDVRDAPGEYQPPDSPFTEPPEPRIPEGRRDPRLEQLKDDDFFSEGSPFEEKPTPPDSMEPAEPQPEQQPPAKPAPQEPVERAPQRLPEARPFEPTEAGPPDDTPGQLEPEPMPEPSAPETPSVLPPADVPDSMQPPTEATAPSQRESDFPEYDLEPPDEMRPEPPVQGPTAEPTWELPDPNQSIDPFAEPEATPPPALDVPDTTPPEIDVPDLAPPRMEDDISSEERGGLRRDEEQLKQEIDEWRRRLGTPPLDDEPRRDAEDRARDDQLFAEDEQEDQDELPCDRIYDDRNCCAQDIRCRTGWNVLANRRLKDIKLDITPPFAPLEKDAAQAREDQIKRLGQAPSRTWYDRDRKPLGTGVMQDFRDGQVIVQGEGGETQLLPILDLSHDDLCFVSAWWGLPSECTVMSTSPEIRDWRLCTYTWKASSLCHKPLYFQDVQLERYGHSAGPILQPLLSTAHFFGNVLLLPYNMGVYPPNECRYPLGHYRPGSCAPWLIPAFPLSERGAKAELISILGLWGYAS